MEDWNCPGDAVIAEGPTCMYCGRICDTMEVVYTGDDESYAGFELWCYCDHCKADTFHRMIKKEDYDKG